MATAEQVLQRLVELAKDLPEGRRSVEKQGEQFVVAVDGPQAIDVAWTLTRPEAEILALLGPEAIDALQRRFGELS